MKFLLIQSDKLTYRLADMVKADSFETAVFELIEHRFLIDLPTEFLTNISCDCMYFLDTDRESNKVRCTYNVGYLWYIVNLPIVELVHLLYLSTGNDADLARQVCLIEEGDDILPIMPTGVPITFDKYSIKLIEPESRFKSITGYNWTTFVSKQK